MPTAIPIKQAATEFLALKRIAVTGVSRNPQGHGSNTVFDRLIERGYDAVPINPNADELGGRTAYPNLTAVPDPVEAVVIGTAPNTPWRPWSKPSNSASPRSGCIVPWTPAASPPRPHNTDASTASA